MRLYIAIIVLILFFSGCFNQYSEINSNNKDLLLPLVSMKRTACHGTCPQYTISIYETGLIKYEGKLFVEKIGCFYGSISKVMINDIKSNLDSIRFFSFNNEYNAPMTDVPSVILEVNISSKNHKVVDRFNGPKELKLFEKFIDNIEESVSKWNDCE